MSQTLSKNDVAEFIQRGFIRIDNAFSQEIADAAIDILWKDIPFERSNPASWIEPVVRLGMYSQKPFIESLNTPLLHTVFNQLIGEGNWIPRNSVGTFPVRFPSAQQPNDTGKHVDASFPGDEPDNYLAWRVNVKSKGRALLMLVLYSDVNDNDAPTIIYEGSHVDVARLLSKEDDYGLSFMELAGKLDALPKRKEVIATGKAGTIYLCHPFLVHAGQPHRGINPKFMAQPALVLRNELSISVSHGTDTPVEQAIRLALE